MDSVGDVATLIGSYLPFVSSSGLVGGDVRQEFRNLSAIGAVLLLGVAPATLRWRHQAVVAALLVVAGLGALSYAGFIVMGRSGLSPSPAELTVRSGRPKQASASARLRR